jgi:predicted nucleic-acid-binding Zn-ribbon protein
MPTTRKVMSALKRAASAFGPGEYAIAGKPIRCPHCGNRTFELGEAQLNTPTLTFLKLDWLDKSATVLVCTACGHLEWFGKRPERKQRQ